MRSVVTLVVLAVIISATGVRAQTAADSAAIRATALDYIEGWYEGSAERMGRALHTELAKRIVVPRPTGAVLQNMTAEQLTQAAGRGGGKTTPPDQQRKDVTILDIYGNAASVKVIAGEWIDYLHIGKVDDHWVIINVLWEFTEEAKEKMQRR